MMVGMNAWAIRMLQSRRAKGLCELPSWEWDVANYAGHRGRQEAARAFHSVPTTPGEIIFPLAALDERAYWAQREADAERRGWK